METEKDLKHNESSQDDSDGFQSELVDAWQSQSRSGLKNGEDSASAARGPEKNPLPQLELVAPADGADRSNRGAASAEAGKEWSPSEWNSTERRDLRETIMHLAEYDHCKFADKGEYADTIDKYLGDYAGKDNVEPGMQRLQELLKKFYENPSREGFAEFNAAFQEFTKNRTRQSLDTVAQLDEERRKTGNTPERRKAEERLTKASDSFYKALDKLPEAEKNRIMCLIDWQDDSSREVRDARVREGLKNYPELLEKYNALTEATAHRDSLRSPREAELVERHRQEVRDNVLARAIFKLVQHRSLIKRSTASG